MKVSTIKSSHLSYHKENWNYPGQVGETIAQPESEIAGRAKGLPGICCLRVLAMIRDQLQGKCEIKASNIKVNFDSVEPRIS